GCLWQNGYIESFNVRLREECLNRRRFMDRDRGASSD
ncbi:MAG: transposase, partial [Opitutae bacterium]|nr:transposase [Opitutae bacterium]